MNGNVTGVIDAYCNNEMMSFKSHGLFDKLSSLVNELDYIIICEYGKVTGNNRTLDFYLSLSVNRKNGECIEIYDDGYLTAATMLVQVDRKERIRFYSWDDEDFLDSISWIIRNLKSIRNGEGFV